MIVPNIPRNASKKEKRSKVREYLRNNSKNPNQIICFKSECGSSVFQQDFPHHSPPEAIEANPPDVPRHTPSRRSPPPPPKPTITKSNINNQSLHPLATMQSTQYQEAMNQCADFALIVDQARELMVYDPQRRAKQKPHDRRFQTNEKWKDSIFGVTPTMRAELYFASC